MNYLFVVAHPDDELLGAGATMYELAQRSEHISVCCLSKESVTRCDNLINGLFTSHKALGHIHYYVADFECMRFKDADHHKMVEFIESAIRDCRADAVFTHHPADLHNDHYITSICCQEAVRLPQRQIGYEHRIQSFMMFEVPSSTDWKLNPSFDRFSPNTYSPVSVEAIDYKVAAIKNSYIDVIRKHPHPRSEENIKALAVLRGSESGFCYAEAFQTIFKLGV